MSEMELPLVIFTILSQTAIGLVAISAIRQYATSGPAGSIKSEWLLATLLILAGLLASLFHLGHPLGAINAIKHLSTAWLSREVLGASIFAALVVVGFLTAKGKVNAALAFITAAVGIITLFFTSMTYAPPSFPALNNAMPLVFFLLTAAMLGSGFASYFTPREKMPLVTGILTASLVVGLVVYIAVPCLWLSGGTVMRETGLTYLSSPLYWSRVVIGLLLPLIAVVMTRRIPAWVPILILIGEVLGRIAFFALTVHASANLGGLY